MPKSQVILEVISIKLSRFSLEQLEEAAVAIKCIEAGKEAVGTKVCYLLKELESTKAALQYQKSECERLELTVSDNLTNALSESKKSERLVNKIKDLKSELRGIARKWKLANEQKEELEFAVINLQQTVLKLSKKEAA